MKVINARYIKSGKTVKAIDCFVDKGYLQGAGGSLPDVDCDFQSDRRQEVKEYIERRYNHDGKQRVFFRWHVHHAEAEGCAERCGEST